MPTRRLVSTQTLSKVFAVSPNTNRQEGSPLFTRIPPEIRNRIFYFALLPYDIIEKPYPSNAYYYRPDYHHYTRIDTALLRTCRLVYLETRHLPIKADEHLFWGGRGPPGLPYRKPSEFFAGLTEEQRDVINRVHLFTQLWWLEADEEFQDGGFAGLCGLRAFRPRSIHITVRQSDWWWWEQNHALALKDTWSRRLCELKGLEKLILELETIERDKEQMYVIANRLSRQQYKLDDGRTLSTAGNVLVKKEWMGPTRYESGPVYNNELKLWNDVTTAPSVDSCTKFCVVILKWSAV